MKDKSQKFEFEPASFVPFRDKEAVARVRAIKREDITRHPNPSQSPKIRCTVALVRAETSRPSRQRQRRWAPRKSSRPSIGFRCTASRSAAASSPGSASPPGSACTVRSLHSCRNPSCRPPARMSGFPRPLPQTSKPAGISDTERMNFGYPCEEGDVIMQTLLSEIL